MERRNRPPRRPGRPPRLSRESILDAGVALLDRSPRVPLTVTRIAAEVGAVPAALYRHFAGVDDVLDGVLGRVLGGVEIEIRKRARWPAQIRDWMASLDGDERFCFCRFTQLGLLRLLTAEAVMGDEVLNQVEAWAVYDRWLADDRVNLVEEPPGLERQFRSLTRTKQTAPKTWADAYLIAFAETAQLTLVTFDRAFRGRVKPLILLEAVEP